MASLKTFIKKLGIEPRDLSLYRQALTHVSVTADSHDSYERLEFLGDSVIGMVISDFLYRKLPLKEEGNLSRIKAAIVSREHLGEKALELKLDRYLRADTVRMREGRQAEISIMSDAFEALTGAIFVDRGYLKAKKFVLDTLAADCMELKEMSGPTDYKSRLQELWQGKCKDTPEYVVTSEKGPDHAKEFTIEVRYRNKCLGKGIGSSKKRAEQEAAREAYELETCGPKKSAKPRKRK